MHIQIFTLNSFHVLQSYYFEIWLSSLSYHFTWLFVRKLQSNNILLTNKILPLQSCTL